MKVSAALSRLRELVKASKDEPVARFESIDKDSIHREADNILCQLIGCDEITEAFEAIDKWYG